MFSTLPLIPSLGKKPSSSNVPMSYKDLDGVIQADVFRRLWQALRLPANVNDDSQAIMAHWCGQDP